MSVLNQSGEELVECPLCMEALEVDDLHFYPCTCGYQICRFCWNRIREGENGLCPACRKAYPEDPADFTPLSQEQVAAIKTEKKARDQKRRNKTLESRRALANVRVVQKNLVFVVGLPVRLADPEILKRQEYFGKYGKIHKVVINQNNTYAGAQPSGSGTTSASAYVTYVSVADALRAIQGVNNVPLDGRVLKGSLGTTKYCANFMKNQPCPKPDCMYLHELGDPKASFTKEEMHAGLHQVYERKLHNQLLQASREKPEEKTNGSGNSSTNGDKGNGKDGTQSNFIQTTVVTSSNINVVNSSKSKKEHNGNGSNGSSVNGKEAWPSLGSSPPSDSPARKQTSPKPHSTVKSQENGNSSTSESSSPTQLEPQPQAQKKTTETKSNRKESTNQKKKDKSKQKSSNSITVSESDKTDYKSNELNSESFKNSEIKTSNSITAHKVKNSEFKTSDSITAHEVKNSEPKEFKTHELKNNETFKNDFKNGEFKNSDFNSSDYKNSEIKNSDYKNRDFKNSDFNNSEFKNSKADNNTKAYSSQNSTAFETEANYLTNELDELESDRHSLLENHDLLDNSDHSLLEDDNTHNLLNDASNDALLMQRHREMMAGLVDNKHMLPHMKNPVLNGYGILDRDMGFLDRHSHINSQVLEKDVLMRDRSQNELLMRQNEMMARHSAMGEPKHYMPSSSIGMENTSELLGANYHNSNMLPQFGMRVDTSMPNSMGTMPNMPANMSNMPMGNSMRNSMGFMLHNQPMMNQMPNGLVNGFDAQTNEGRYLAENMDKFFTDFHKAQQLRMQLNRGSDDRRLPHHVHARDLDHKQRLNAGGNGGRAAGDGDDDLDFDPFKETQKAFAELMETEMVQNQGQVSSGDNIERVRRTRMAPPGFSHLNNSFGLGAPRNPQQHQQQQQHGFMNSNNTNAAYTDWTQMDPAIMSVNFAKNQPPPPQPQPQPHQQQHQQQQQLSQHELFARFNQLSMNPPNGLSKGLHAPWPGHAPPAAQTHKLPWTPAPFNSIPLPPGFAPAKPSQHPAECIDAK